MHISTKQTDTHKCCMCIYTLPSAICLKFVSERGKYKAFCMLTKIYIFKTFIFVYSYSRSGGSPQWHLTEMAAATAAGDMGCSKNENTSSFQSRSDNGLQKQLKPWYLGVRHEPYKGITARSTQRLHRKRSCCLECVHPSRFSVRQTLCQCWKTRMCKTCVQTEPGKLRNGRWNIQVSGAQGWKGKKRVKEGLNTLIIYTSTNLVASLCYCRKCNTYNHICVVSLQHIKSRDKARRTLLSLK